MLVTSGQVSVVLSCGIVVLFTFLLFLTGYTLQRQTVDALSAGIKPRVRLLASQIQAGIDLELDSDIGGATGTSAYANRDARGQKALRRAGLEAERSDYVGEGYGVEKEAEEEVQLLVTDTQILTDLARARARGEDGSGYMRDEVSDGGGGMSDSDGQGERVNEGRYSGRPKRIRLEAPTGLDRIAGGKRWEKAEDGWRVVDVGVSEGQ